MAQSYTKYIEVREGVRRFLGLCIKIILECQRYKNILPLQNGGEVVKKVG